MSVLTVGIGQQFATLSAAVAAAHNGDTIYVAAGTYVNDFSIIYKQLTIIGVGGMAHFVADGTVPIPNGKAIFVTGANISLDHIELSGAKVPDGNGAGIRYEAGALTITNSYLHNNQDGLLANAVSGGAITIDHTEFGFNGKGDGYTHNLYVNRVATLSITDSYFHDAIVGHEIKSRASNTIIQNSRILDNDSTASYSIDLPNGGAATIENNLIQQGPHSQNSAIISYAEETSTPYANSELLVTGNTIVNQRVTATAVFNHASIIAQITGNHFYGLTAAQIAQGPNARSGNDFLSSPPAMDTSHPWAASPWDALFSGGSEDDVLGGSAGRDLIVGGGGNDTFIIRAGQSSDTIADFVAGAGIGDVVAFDSYAFADFSAVTAAMVQSGTDTVLDLQNGEMLTFLGVSKASFAADDFAFIHDPSPFVLPLSGPPANIIIGAVPDDLLVGSGGNDQINGRYVAVTMLGGAGDDTYLVGKYRSMIVEAPGEGTDTVVSRALTFTLPANVENLTLSGAHSHTGFGNELDNLISASTGGDVIDGRGGNDVINAGGGADTLTGGAGNNMFVFSTLGAESSITDFHNGEDLIDLRPLLAAGGYAGTDPIADGVIALSSDGNHGTIISVDPAKTGTLHALIDVLGVAPGALAVGSDILWH